jgi:transcription elongation factor Elf1
LLLKLVEDHYPLPSEPRHVQAESDVESAESEEESMKCDVCNLEDKSEALLECSHCGSRQHSACLIPPMLEKPVGDWLCSECGEKTSDYQVERRHYIAEMGRRFEAAKQRKTMMLDTIRKLDLPNNPLDDIIDQVKVIDSSYYEFPG